MHLLRPTSRNQSGFSVIETLLVVLVITVLSVSGFVVYQRHKPSSAKSSAATGNAQTSTQSQSATTTQPAPVNTQYLTIKEWGVKLPLSDSIKDVYYVVSNGSADTNGQPNTMWLGLTSLDSKGCAASLGNTNGADKPIGALGRALPTDHEPVKGTLYTQLYPGMTLGGYYYFYISGTNGKTCAPQTTLQSVDSAFTTAAKGIVAATDPNYLVIKEWGIRAPYSSSLNLQYTARDSGNIALSSSQLAAGGPAVCSASGNSDAGFLARYLPTDSNLAPNIPPNETAEQYIEQNAAFPHAKIANYIYIYWGNNYLKNGAYNGPCKDKTTALETIAAYSDLVPKLEAIQ